MNHVHTRKESKGVPKRKELLEDPRLIRMKPFHPPFLEIVRYICF